MGETEPPALVPVVPWAEDQKGTSHPMSYKITLEVYVSKETTWPRIKIESTPRVEEWQRARALPTDTDDVAAFEGVLTEVREFAEGITRGVETEGVPVE